MYKHPVAMTAQHFILFADYFNHNKRNVTRNGSEERFWISFTESLTLSIIFVIIIPIIMRNNCKDEYYKSFFLNRLWCWIENAEDVNHHFQAKYKNCCRDKNYFGVFCKRSQKFYLLSRLVKCAAEHLNQQRTLKKLRVGNAQISNQ